LCEGGPQGYFTGDLDKLAEPLLFRKYTLTSPIPLSSSPITPVVSRTTG
jgi:hypothetical protein